MKQFRQLAPLALIVFIPAVFGGLLEDQQAMARVAIAAAGFLSVSYGFDFYETEIRKAIETGTQPSMFTAGKIMIYGTLAILMFTVRPVFFVVLCYAAVRVFWTLLSIRTPDWIKPLTEKKASPIGLKYLTWDSVAAIITGSAIRYIAGALGSGTSPFFWIPVVVLLLVIAFRLVWNTDEAVDRITKAPARGETPGY